MYPSPVVPRPPSAAGEDHLRREPRIDTSAPPMGYSNPSPTLASSHQRSPTTSYPQPAYNGYPSRPPSSAAPPPVLPNINQSPRAGPPGSPPGISRAAYPSRERTYYDPTSEHREGGSSWNRHSPYPGRSPTQTHESSVSYADNRIDNNGMTGQTSHRSPTNSRLPHHSPTFPNLHAHPSRHHTSPLTKSPSPRSQQTHSSISHIMNGTSDYSAPTESKPVEPSPPTKVEPVKQRNIMSLSTMLSSNAVEDVKPLPKVEPPSSSRGPSREPKMSNGEVSTIKRPPSPTVDSPRKTPKLSPPKDKPPRKDTGRDATRSSKQSKPALVKKPPVTSKEEEKVRAAMAEIDANYKSDGEGTGLDGFKVKHVELCDKRLQKVREVDGARRRRRRVTSVARFSIPIDKMVAEGKSHFRHKNEQDVQDEVHRQEVLDEKERKKDMQRKRRREKTVLQETQKRKELMQKAEQVDDDEERDKLMREAQKAGKKAEFTQNILDNIGGDAEEPLDLRKAINMDGGTISTFNANGGASPEPARKKQKTGPTTRPKKSKEKKQAEKEAAEQAYAAMEKDEPVTIAPKDEGRRESLREPKESKSRKKAAADVAPPPPTTTYSSKGFQQIHEQIWKDLARKDAPKVYRIKDQSLAQKQSNLRKTAQLGGKEARRWQQRTNKSMKDVQARSKRNMREMMSFWKRNEREERDLRRMAEKQEHEKAKKAEVEREENRQKRKLDFLIRQTALFAHFVSKKTKTDEIERSTDTAGVTVAQNPDASTGPSVTLTNGASRPGATATTDFNDLDFDAEDETTLQEAAEANAYAAVQEAQAKARAFNNQGTEAEAPMDEGELDFQNPIVGDIEVPQPRMLTCQLKEYQLKGLNWLANLYEQGINGILADEMGLGKTVQSISVMAYLAERHNIWGPSLVIAPSSTLHNWQQEIARFVPDLKVVPYWGTSKDRKILRKFWDRKAVTYDRESEGHVVITSYQLVVQDAQYFQKMQWQYMILDEAQAIKSSNSSRWRVLMSFRCRNRLLLTGTPIQNNMQELWALLHFIMPTLFDNHDEFNDWFSKDIENHAQSNSKLNEQQLQRLHQILKPFMLRRVKKHVQKELGDKIEKDVACYLTYRQRAYYTSLRNKINFMDLVDTVVDRKEDVTNLMNLVVQFRKVCNHPSLFTTADITSPLSLVHFADCASFAREGYSVNLAYSTRNLIQYDLPRLLCGPAGRIHEPGPSNPRAGFRNKYLKHLMNIWTPEYIREHSDNSKAFSWLRFTDTSVGEACKAAHSDLVSQAIARRDRKARLGRMNAIYEDTDNSSFVPASALFNIVERNDRQPLADLSANGHMSSLLNVSNSRWADSGLATLEPCARPAAQSPPIEICCSNQSARHETQDAFFNIPIRRALHGLSAQDELALLEAKIDPAFYPPHDLLPAPTSPRRYTQIQVPSMRRFVSDCGKLARLDALLGELKAGGHRVLIYFQMTRMMDLMEEYMTYRNYKYLRLDGSTKLEDRRDRVHDFQTRPDIFVFLLSTRAGGLGINLTSADTVVFYDSDWNPTIDSQAMDRAHRLGQTRQVTVYRLITHGTVEERIRKRALQKEEVQRVVISGGSAGGVDFNTRSKENKAKDIAMWLADDEQAEMLEKREREAAEAAERGEGDAAAAAAAPRVKAKKKATGGRKREVNMDDMYHEGEGHFEDNSNKPSGAATPANGGDSDAAPGPGGRRGPRGGRGLSKKAKTAKQRLAIADGSVDMG